MFRCSLRAILRMPDQRLLIRQPLPPAIAGPAPTQTTAAFRACRSASLGLACLRFVGGQTSQKASGQRDCQRWVRSVRTECLDLVHLNERHL